jgi:uncharacterized membrane protein YjgN (DUF898 family)
MINSEAAGLSISDNETDRQPREYRFQFTGSGSEYFSIWIVNLLLSILTLGIYSAWAKVRREQYFHRNTLLDDQPFDYTGNPRSILLGRVLALVVIGAGSALQKINITLALGVAAFFVLIYPWVIVRSAKFRARNTRYRNLAFRFTGTTLEAVKVYFWLYIVFLPLVFFSVYYGPQLRDLQAQGDAADPQLITRIGINVFIAMGVSLLLFVGLWPVYLCRIKAFVHRHLHYGNAQGDFDGTIKDFYRALVRTAGVSLLGLILIAVIGGLAFAIHLPFLALAGYLVLLLPSAAYMVNVTNVTYAHASIGGQRFASDMKIIPYLLLLLTNLLILTFSLGLAWPWIQVRLARYRIEHLSIMATAGSFESILGEAQQNPSAFGEEVGEFLDFDISL